MLMGINSINAGSILLLSRIAFFLKSMLIK
jgi:hypothetical protein